MLAGVSYEAASAAAGVCLEGEGLEPRHLERLLNHLTCADWQFRRTRRRPVAAARLPVRPAAVLIARAGHEPDHWAATANGIVYDPEWAENWGPAPDFRGYQQWRPEARVAGMICCY